MDHELAGAYEHELRYLIDYARTDWLGFSTIVCSTSVLSRLDGTRRRQQEFAFDLVGDLLDRSIVAGDFTSSDEIPFEP
ncbi:hypothetical protein B1964_01565 [Gordonia sp. i37]|nr:hypothetical protein B1964_01565 [Gordonia sp. i37]